MTDSPAQVRPDRRAELAAGLARVRSRIADACAAAGRERSEVTMIAVTKTYPASDVIALAGLGVTDVGENRDQEAAAKAAQVAAARVTPRWHFIGQLQRNKVKSVVRYADMVQSVDRVRLVSALDVAATAARDRQLDVLVQVSVDGDAARGGAVPASSDPDVGFGPVVEAVAAAPGLRLAGVMAVAPLGWEPVRAFGRLAALAEALRAEHPQATIVSAGMSGDLEAAISQGATHVRVGSALLGMRPTLR
ncbi:YggS family pyridoxal phosphate-dependent enzyme [Micromonospora endophytica]|uniref:Pyridoxal phosphate homeostasis protein n=1 Tax=Micromonospora endophytica TaxID=515350 RepID=A0A2W2CIL2_9ACTN|nr:YggS family pyridoxal phosphate-dependent enzyme [Micromonospora endophytica]PZF91558.1 YggS family pyridoxal phosphate-dependent enzyme [Micromonospora endophytica]RIW48496.1 YggS family pyridoxal phosphate-dependent enzyme [Micromonospora endophytica]BCJ61176.1 YggS family pyridoxal phosphate enzyme [Micromonospora endophytica]